jgi:glucose-1-phosphate thymidylyltransferase
MKGIILAGGFGTRMLPASHTNNKHLLPVYTSEGAFPMIEYPIRTLTDIGITEILIITSQDHCGIIVDYLGDGYSRGLEFTYKIQEMNDPHRPPGIASALKLCKDYTKQEDFVAILGDNYFEPMSNRIGTGEVSEFISRCRFNNKTKCGLFLKYTDDWNRFGVAEFDTPSYKILDIVEKPVNYISNYAVTGMYYYTPDVYNIVEDILPSDRGELEITDINRYYAKLDNVGYMVYDGFWSDMGTPESMINTINFINKKIKLTKY